MTILLELKNVGPNQYQLWATGSVGTCDWAQIFFSGGYKLLILVIILNIWVCRGDVEKEIKDFYAHVKSGKEIVKIC